MSGRPDYVLAAFDSMLCRPSKDGWTDCLLCIHPEKPGWRVGTPEVHQEDCPRQVLINYTAAMRDENAALLEALRRERSAWEVAHKAARDWESAHDARKAERDELAAEVARLRGRDA